MGVELSERGPAHFSAHMRTHWSGRANQRAGMLPVGGAKGRRYLAGRGGSRVTLSAVEDGNRLFSQQPGDGRALCSGRL